MINLNSPLKPCLKKLNKLLERINESGWYTNFGPLHNELTDRLEDYLGVRNLLLTNNGTVALQVASRSIGSNSILTTPFSFVATSSAFKWQKDEITFTDIDKYSLNLSPNSIVKAYKKGCQSDTVVATHVYGNPCDVVTIQSNSQIYNFKTIYDASHAFGVKIDSESVLNFGDASTLSFHATKLFHTVEGGGIIFKDKENFEKAKKIINFGISPGEGIVDTGINAKLNEYQAAVGLVNLDDIDLVLEHRSELFVRYREGLKNTVELPLWHPNANQTGAYMPILLKDNKQLNRLMRELSDCGIQSRNYFSPSLDKVFSDSKNYGTKESANVSERILCLPMHAHLSVSDVDKVVNAIKKRIL